LSPNVILKFVLIRKHSLPGFLGHGSLS
jgi:hypothetical protein